MEINNYQLSSYFLNQKLFLSSLSPNLVDEYETKALNINYYDDHLNKIFIDKYSMDLTLEHIQRNEVPVLEKLIITNALNIDSLFYSDYTFTFKNLKKVNSYDKPFQKTFYLELPQYNIKIEGEYNTAHYTCNTAFTNLSKKYKCFLYGKIESFNETKRILKIRPIVFAEKLIKFQNDKDNHPFRAYIVEKNRLNIEDFDEFKKVKKFNKKVDFSVLASIPEKEIKRMFAEIIHENNIPKDWGGETSDLYTYNLHLGKKRIRAAFAFKGPAKNKVLEPKDLGKNGDQIVRLFHETADVYILQHCNYIKGTVETTMDAFSTQHLRSRKYVIINGEDTYRLLKSYNKI
ncbi:hypothetical protein EHQ68_12710 [Leptospira congkakensis]|uniref:Uncharacterized protein n=1 Tax=Leptospira congkakensis TaxID=2484932 RepID=A0A4Z0ZYJ2_9LEPT|nr:hypothetical protein [Leptospira congkakensis]TGL87398.1 hypothetical protein EHQ68_12710 [Leptospira congkakensis]TGL92967.1 hypothetical protein EHQ69_07310 [Leptospira congkakensis]TGL93246.1 hypothetical protein EHQ70_18045 [Leptospira congkakensis]